MLFPPLTALPIASVRAAARHAGRDSLTAPMLRVRTKSNGMSAWLDMYEPAVAGLVPAVML